MFEYIKFKFYLQLIPLKSLIFRIGFQNRTQLLKIRKKFKNIFAFKTKKINTILYQKSQTKK